MSLDEWFLAAAERGNPATEIDRRHADGAAWTTGNRASVLIDGTAYFARLYDVLDATRAGDWVYFTDWQGDPDEQLVGSETEIGAVFVRLVQRGVRVRGLLWRSHPEAMGFGEAKNLQFSRAINEVGGEVLLDQRVRRGGSHHQKLVVVRGLDVRADVAFVGGIDLCHGRRDDPDHAGDPQVVELDHDRYGERPPWHDIQLEVRGPAVDDLAWTFAERWDDPAPLDSRTPLRAALHRYSRHPNVPSELAPSRTPPADGPVAIQVLRTYPARRVGYPFAPSGERSIARAYLKAFGRARCFVYIEDQYLWSLAATAALATALRTRPSLHVVAILPRYPDPGGLLAGDASRIGRERVLDALSAAGGDRVAVYDLENQAGVPVYVHSKVCIVDDVWMAVGSDNLNRRSWTNDSELSCALLDDRHDSREPVDPAGLGDGARRLARDTRLELAREHLGRDQDLDDLADPLAWFDALRDSARLVDEWHRGGCSGPRPRGHLRVHPIERVRGLRRLGKRALHATLLDPDGRPRALQAREEF